MTANLAARYDDPLSVALGAVLALWAVASIGILGGRALMKYVPLRLITKVAAVVMLALAGFSLYEAVAACYPDALIPGGADRGGETGRQYPRPRAARRKHSPPAQQSWPVAGPPSLSA
jgi:hypothetical protein